MEAEIDKSHYYQHVLFKLDRWLYRRVFAQWKAVSNISSGEVTPRKIILLGKKVKADEDGC